nr:CocE/NonD family hydrolase [Mucilaginibacter sp. L294]
MNRKICMAWLCLFATFYCKAQQINLPKININDSITIAKEMPLLAANALSRYKSEADEKTRLNNLFRLQALAGNYKGSALSITALRAISGSDDKLFPGLLYVQHQLFVSAMQKQVASNVQFKTVFPLLLDSFLRKTTDQEAFHIYTAFITRNGVNSLKTDFQKSLANMKQKDSITVNDAIVLCKSYYLLNLYQNIEDVSKRLIKEDQDRRYSVQYVLIKTKDGASISSVIVKRRGITQPQPVVLQYTIYADSTDRTAILEPAVHSYTAVMAYTRGKALSPDKIIPFENDGSDANDVIDWISKQSWCNGKIGMYGGSYNGFTQWAAAKYHHPALKTIVPYVAAIPGLGLPMENNVFINANYAWPFYTTDNKYLDNKTYNDERWNALPNKWYASGAAYSKIDSIDGTPNPWLQCWLKHPDYDKYWQDQVPYKQDFAKINIPVLTFTGYYDDGQISAMHYFREHRKYNPKANQYLIIGPYDHFGAQRGGVPVLREYKVDSVALISTREITFQWLDYILKGAAKPEILQDKINFEVMGANTWRHVPTLEKMADKTLTLYLTDKKDLTNYMLSAIKPVKPAAITQEVDLADRKTDYNDYYPYPIIREVSRDNGLFFITKPFDKAIAVNGSFTGELKAIINKKDMDIGVTLFEVMPDGRYFQLSYFLGRASYAKDMSVRKLLHPGQVETIPFERTRMVSRQLSKGSRLMVVVNINKNPFAQVNYGTGKDVSNETIKDGKVPLKIKWLTNSFIKIPVSE